MALVLKVVILILLRKHTVILGVVKFQKSKTDVVLLNTPNNAHTFSVEQFRRNLHFIFNSLSYVINHTFLIRKFLFPK